MELGSFSAKVLANWQKIFSIHFKGLFKLKIFNPLIISVAHLPPHDASHLVLGLGDGGRHHEPDEVGEEHHVEDHEPGKHLPAQALGQGDQGLLGLGLRLLLDWRRLLLRLWGQGFDDVQHFEQDLLLEGGQQ